MEDSLMILIPLSVILVFLIGLLFWWAVRAGQFDDLEGPGFCVLMDDPPLRAPAPDRGVNTEGNTLV